MPRFSFIFIASSFIVFILDQCTKIWIKSTLIITQSKKILPFFSLTYVENKGIAFGMFHNGGNIKHYALLIATLIAISAIIYLFYSSKNLSVSKSLIFGMIIGGAFGNLYDRFFRGYVIDFLDFYLVNKHWPVFNLADSFITIGILFIFYKQIFKKEEIF